MTNCGGAVTFDCGVQGPQGIPGPPGATAASVVTATSDQVLTSAQNATLFVNAGAEGEVDLTLPPAPSPFTPLSYSLLVAAAQNVSFTAPSGVTITNGADSSASGGSITSNTIGNFLTLLLVSPTQYIVTSITGVWNFS